MRVAWACCRRSVRVLLAVSFLSVVDSGGCGRLAVVGWGWTGGAGCWGRWICGCAGRVGACLVAIAKWRVDGVAGGGVIGGCWSAPAFLSVSTVSVWCGWVAVRGRVMAGWWCRPVEVRSCFGVRSVSRLLGFRCRSGVVAPGLLPVIVLGLAF
ncbi:unnamed protein product [Rhodiola kirilowii]